MKTTVDDSSIAEQLNPQPANAPASTPSFFQIPTSPYIKPPTMEQIIIRAFLKNIPIFLVTLALIFLVACSSEPERDITRKYLDDKVIATPVNAAILAEASLKFSEINVDF